MRNALLFIFLISYVGTFAQRVYEFDYLIHYDFYWDHKTSRPAPYLYLTNSQNNEFTAVITESDSVTLKLDFLDHKGNHAIAKMAKGQFASTMDLWMKCSDVKPHSNTKKSLARRYEFKILKDTTISGRTLAHYILKSKKKDGNATEHYIVDTRLDRHLPILRYATAFTKWESTMNLPNGIISEKYLKGNNGKKRHRMVLKDYKTTNKAIIIPEDCDYSN